MDNNILISIIVATYNRRDILHDALNSFLLQRKENNFGYEVIVVDNNSSDGTKGLVESLVPKFNGTLRYVFEPKQGTCPARNRGIREARGELVAFVDDDSIVDKDWLENIKRDFESHPDIAGIAGKILPRLKCETPYWLTLQGDYILKGALNYYDHGNEVFYIKDDEKPFLGANMVVKKEILEKYGMFYEGIKTINGRQIIYEDTEFYYRIKKMGEKIIYAPNVAVEHVFDKIRINKKYFRKWYYYTGISTAISKYVESGARIFKIPAWLIRRVMRDFFKSLINYIKLDFIKAFYYESDLYFMLGEARGYSIYKRIKPEDWRKVI